MAKARRCFRKDAGFSCVCENHLPTKAVEQSAPKLQPRQGRNVLAQGVSSG